MRISEFEIDGASCSSSLAAPSALDSPSPNHRHRPRRASRHHVIRCGHGPVANTYHARCSPHPMGRGAMGYRRSTHTASRTSGSRSSSVTRSCSSRPGTTRGRGRRPGHAPHPYRRHHPPICGHQPARRRHRVGPAALLGQHLRAVLRPRRPTAVVRTGRVTRNNVDRIARGQAAYAHSLGTGNDPLSGSWTPNGLTGGWIGDTKLEEMGVYAQAIAPGLAWATDDPAAAAGASGS